MSSHKVYKGLALQNLSLPKIHLLSKHCWCTCSPPGTVLYIIGYLQVHERASAQEQLRGKPWAWVPTALVIKADIRCSIVSPERYTLLRECREGKMLSQGWLGRGWRMIHVEETVALDLGRELEFGQFELGKKTEGWTWLEQSHRRGKRASGLRFPNSNWTWI